MSRMKSFLTYLLILIAFFIVSNILEEGLIKNMYYDMDGEVKTDFVYNNVITDIDIDVVDAEYTRRNGYIVLDITNNSSIDLGEAYIKVDFYSQSGIHAMTKYMDLSDFKSGTTREYKVNFSGSYIDWYRISLSSVYPNKENIIHVFGYDINTKDVLGFDVSEYVNASNFRSVGGFIYDTLIVGFSTTVERLPWWAWGAAWLIVLTV